MKEELQGQLDAAKSSLKKQEVQLKTAREEGQALQGKLDKAQEDKTAAEKVRLGARVQGMFRWKHLGCSGLGPGLGLCQLALVKAIVGQCVVGCN